MELEKKEGDLCRFLVRLQKSLLVVFCKWHQVKFFELGRVSLCISLVGQGTPIKRQVSKRQVSKRQVSKRQVSKRLVSKRQVY